MGDADSAVRRHLVFGFCGKDEVSTVRFALIAELWDSVGC